MANSAIETSGFIFFGQWLNMHFHCSTFQRNGLIDHCIWRNKGTGKVIEEAVGSAQPVGIFLPDELDIIFQFSRLDLTIAGLQYIQLCLADGIGIVFLSV